MLIGLLKHVKITRPYISMSLTELFEMAVGLLEGSPPFKFFGNVYQSLESNDPGGL
jgi:hypothetical protein